MKDFVDKYLLRKGLSLSPKEEKTYIRNLKNRKIEFLGLTLDRNSIREKDLSKILTYIQKDIFDTKHKDYKYLKSKKLNNEDLKKETIKLMNQKIQGIFNYYRYYHVEKLTHSVNSLISSQVKQYPSYKDLFLLDSTKIKEIISVKEWKTLFKK